MAAGPLTDTSRSQLLDVEVYLGPVDANIGNRAACANQLSITTSKPSISPKCSFASSLTSCPALGLIVCVAPIFLETSNLDSSRSNITSFRREYSCAVHKAASPTGPVPTMATVQPGLTPPRRTPTSRPVGRMSLRTNKDLSSAPL